jgi:hypothetical protein
LSKKIEEAKITNSKVVERQKVVESLSGNGNIKKVEHALNEWL